MLDVREEVDNTIKEYRSELERVNHVIQSVHGDLDVHTEKQRTYRSEISNELQTFRE